LGPLPKKGGGVKQKGGARTRSNQTPTEKGHSALLEGIDSDGKGGKQERKEKRTSFSEKGGKKKVDLAVAYKRFKREKERRN